MQSVVKLVQTACVHTAAVFQSQTCLKLISGRKVPASRFVIDRNNRRESPSALVAVEFAVSNQGSEIGQSLRLEEFRSRHIDSASRSLHFYIDVAHVAIIVTVGINDTSAHIDIQIRVDAIADAKLTAEIILAALHVRIERITAHRTWSQSANQHRHHSHLAFKRRQTIGEVTLSATACHTQMECGKPLFAHASQVERRHHRSRGLTVKTLDTVRIVAHAVDRSERKRASILRTKIRSRRSALISTLYVESQMPTNRHKTNAGRIGIGTVNADGTITRRITQEINALVRVRQVTTSLRSGCSHQQRGCEN